MSTSINWQELATELRKDGKDFLLVHAKSKKKLAVVGLRVPIRCAEYVRLESALSVLRSLHPPLSPFPAPSNNVQQFEQYSSTITIRIEGLRCPDCAFQHLASGLPTDLSCSAI
jgi:hypothetical protein